MYVCVCVHCEQESLELKTQKRKDCKANTSITKLSISKLASVASILTNTHSMKAFLEIRGEAITYMYMHM